MNIIWILFRILDWTLFAFVAMTVIYMLIFAIASFFAHRPEVQKSKHYNRFIVLIPAYHQDQAIIQTVNAMLGQNYPQRMFDIVVISDHQKEMTNMMLAQMPITLLTPNFERSTKAKSLQYAILNLPQFKIYDAVIILDAGNIVEPEFLEQVNDAYETAGTKVIQTHRVPRNRDTSAARLDAIFEEINNAVFRRGHLTLGLSAAVNGSGTIYDFEWFKRNIMKVRSATSEDKELEALIMREGIYIDYFDNIRVYAEKVRNIYDFNAQRAHWISSQLHVLIGNLRYLPSTILNRRYDHMDKLIQWLLVPRTIMMGFILIMSLVVPYFYFTEGIKWWVAGALAMLAFSLATPDELVDENWDKDFLKAPLLTLWGLINIARAGKTEANVRLSALARMFHGMLPQKKQKKAITKSKQKRQ